MTDSKPKRRGDKRERLVASAAELLHKQGVAEPTLAEIATAAEVPPGNVYYYFKTRDELIAAVIARHAEAVRGLLESLEQRPSPASRLKGLVHSWADVSEMVASNGCPLGSLCSELNKLDRGLGRDAAGLLGAIVDWAEGQFRQLGLRSPRDLAISLLARVQGAALLADTFEDPAVMKREVRRIERWVDSLVE